MTLGLVYFSATGTTAALADAVRGGAINAGIEVYEHAICGTDIVDGRWANEAVLTELDRCRGIAFGSPTYMGGMAAQFKAFVDATSPRWYSEAWRDKYAAAFTASAKTSGDKLNCLSDMVVFAMQMGMIWVGNAGGMAEPSGFYLGVGATAGAPSDLGEVDLARGHALGARLADLCQD